MVAVLCRVLVGAPPLLLSYSYRARQVVVVPALCVSLVRAALGVGAFGPTPDRMLLLTILITGTSPTAMNVSTIAGLVGRWQVGT